MPRARLSASASAPPSAGLPLTCRSPLPAHAVPCPQFVSALSASARARVVALADIDPRKVGKPYTNHQLREPDGRLAPPLTLPVIHTREIRGPAAVCVSLRRADEGVPGEIQRAAAALGLLEGETLWYIF